MNGKIGVTTENIFPIIKKFLYSDHEIFLRELVSNAVDATQKLKALSLSGEVKSELGDTTIRITLDKDKKTLTISDAGVGMDAGEIERYINQIAFSGAEEFLAKYKDKTNIIGHFGLGFYSSFMVSDKVEIFTKSYKDTPAMHWECDGSPEYSLDETTARTQRGTDIVLHIAEENAEFLDETRIKALLNKYCKFLPIPIAFGKEQEWKDGKYVDTGKDNIINDTSPLWTRTPADLKEEDYLAFYRQLYPMSEAPLFYIHLNVDYPFTLTGVLYFPKIRSNIDFQKNKIQLYCNQVFVTDSVEGIVPDFLTLLHGVIDSPDIPLNVSRSYLQSDSNVKKISAHITKKVADRLQDIFKNNRPQLEEKWDDLKLFMEYGMITDDKFYERAENFFLLKNVDGKCFTMEEYRTLVEANQTDKEKNVVYLYSSDKDEQYSAIAEAKAKGYDVLLFDGQLDAHFINKLEEKLKNTRFVRVDSDIVSRLIEKGDSPESKLSAEQQAELQAIFEANVPTSNKEQYMVNVDALSENDAPVLITQNEFMRRMKDMSAASGNNGMNFYGNMGDMLTLVVNANHPLVQQLNAEKDSTLAARLVEANAAIEKCEASYDELHKQHEGKKDEEIAQPLKDEESEAQKHLNEAREQKQKMLLDFGKKSKLAQQLVDLALLANNRLKGEALDRFVKRSVELIEKK